MTRTPRTRETSGPKRCSSSWRTWSAKYGADCPGLASKRTRTGERRTRSYSA